MDRLIRAMLGGDVATFDTMVADGQGDLYQVTEPDRWNLLHRTLVSVTLTPSPAIVERLIRLGVDVRAPDVMGNTPLHFAVRGRSLEIVSMLLDAGADIEAVNADGSTPLRMAFARKPYRPHMVALLLQRGADMNHRSPTGGLTIRALAETICHGTDRAIIELFDRFSSQSG